MLSAKMEDYLKAVYELQRETDEPVSTSAVADALGVTPPTATSMMENLAEQGLVEREKYKGARLTTEGETVALEIVRHHRLLETYLTEQLGYDWAAVHDEADRLEHHISEEFERRVADVLDDPRFDPHGDPIPDDSLEPIDESPGLRLAECAEGERVVVERVRDRDPEELAYLDDAGITPGTELELVEVAPIDMITVRVVGVDGESGSEGGGGGGGGNRGSDAGVSLPAAVADAIFVGPAGEKSPGAANGVAR